METFLNHHYMLCARRSRVFVATINKPREIIQKVEISMPAYLKECGVLLLFVKKKSKVFYKVLAFHITFHTDLLIQLFWPIIFNKFLSLNY